MEEKELEKDINVPNKLSDEEIAISLECCVDSNCDDCPYTKKKIDCAGGRHEKDCIELINRLGCTTTRNSWKNKFLKIVKEKEELQKQVDKLKEENEYLDMCGKQFFADYQKVEVELAELKEERENMQAEIERLTERNYWLQSNHEYQCEKSYFEGVEKGKEQAVKDTAKEIWDDCVDKIMRGCGDDKEFWVMEILIETFKKYGVGFEVE